MESIYIPLDMDIDSLQPTEQAVREKSIDDIARTYPCAGTVERITVARFNGMNIIQDGNNRAYYFHRLKFRKIPANYHPFIFVEVKDGKYITSPVADAFEMIEAGITHVKHMNICFFRSEFLIYDLR